MFKKVVVGISGGVDSAVTALLLKSKGFQVIGAFMKNWDIANEVGECLADKELEDAKWICDKLQIPIIDINFVKDYWNEVFCYLLDVYQEGKTPNPDVMCNKKIKFDKFFHFARHELGADAIATGHYARSSFGPYLEYFNPNKNAALLQAKDFKKDQTLFLSQISQESLKRTMFPLGDYYKKDVKKIAKEANLDLVLNKRESVGICFIGRRNFQDFIVEYIEDRPGDFIDITTGLSVGKHNGFHQWTKGQCCRIGGKSVSYYVCEKDNSKNNIYVVPGSNHPALFSEFIMSSKIHWINEEPYQLKNGRIFDCEFRFQHRNPLVPCSVFKSVNNKLFIRLHEPLKALTPGQYATFYHGEECLGSAEILYSGPSYYLLDKEVDTVELKKQLMDVT